MLHVDVHVFDKPEAEDGGGGVGDDAQLGHYKPSPTCSIVILQAGSSLSVFSSP